jgi:hypothetical protein
MSDPPTPIPLVTEAIALYHAIEAAKNSAREMDPNGEEINNLREKVYRSGAVLQKAQGLFRFMRQEYNVPDPASQLARSSPPPRVPGTIQSRFFCISLSRF